MSPHSSRSISQPSLTLLVLALLSSGCTSEHWWVDYTPPSLKIFEKPAPPLANPQWVPEVDHEWVWENVADVVDDYFRIEREEPVRRIEDYVEEGVLYTYPSLGSTFFEPWRRDSTTSYEKLESTLQTIRRSATVSVVPGQGGFWVQVVVNKELEDRPRPEHATAGAAIFRNDNSLNRYSDPLLELNASRGWIPRGRDEHLEQQMLAQIYCRLVPPN